MSSTPSPPLAPDRYRHLLESMSEGVSLSAQDSGLIAYANPAQDRMFGYEPGELVGRRLSSLNAYPSDVHDRLVAEVLEALAREGHWRGEWRNRRKDGSGFTTRSRISTVELDGAAYWLCVQEEVTEPRLAEDALRDSEARLELATLASNLGVWDWNLLTDEMVYSPRAKQIYGLPADEPLNRDRIRSFTHPDDLERTSAQSRRALDPALREEAAYQYRITRTDGEMRWLVSHGRALFAAGDDGVVRAVRYVGTLDDITERKRTADSLRSSNRRLRLALDAGRMCVWDYDIVADKLDATPELKRLLGFAPDAALSTEDIRKRYFPGEEDRVRRTVATALERGERFVEVEFQYAWPDGQARWLLMRAELMLRDGAPARAIGILLDTTERREAEDRMRWLASEVDHRANNLMSVVQATVHLSTADSVAELKRTLQGRVAALANAHQLLAESRWEGADLRRLAEEELKPYRAAGTDRVAISGPTWALPPQAAQSVSMALHELATNAAKYGALSTPGGRIALDWARDPDGGLALRWRETGGGAIRPPTRGGFGLRMVDRAIGHQLGGVATFEWRPEGLACDIRIAASALAPAEDGKVKQALGDIARGGEGGA